MAADPTLHAVPPTALLTPGQVARRFGVSPKTVSRWADRGALQAVRTKGGHRRFRAVDVASLRAQMEAAAAPAGRQEVGEG
jgi:excisionase family DNA binding protein